MRASEDQKWIRRIRKGETEKFSFLYEKYHRKLFAMCFQYTRNKSDAEEQLQEIFIRILQKIDSYKERSSFSTWMTRLAINHLINFQNRRRDRFEQELEAIHEVISTSNAEQLILDMELKKAIFRLPEGQRNVVILHDQLGFSHIEIAEIIGIDPVSSRSRLSRARLALRELLSDFRSRN